MDRAEIESKLKDLLVSELGLEADKVTGDASFEEDLEVDSLSSCSWQWRTNSV